MKYQQLPAETRQQQKRTKREREYKNPSLSFWSICGRYDVGCVAAPNIKKVYFDLFRLPLVGGIVLHNFNFNSIHKQNVNFFFYFVADTTIGEDFKNSQDSGLELGK